MTNIATAAITPIMGLRNTSVTNNASSNTASAAMASSINGKHAEEEPTNMDKGLPQQMVVSPPSPSFSQKGTTPYNNINDIDVNSSMLNNNYITASNPNSLMARGHGVTATQLTGVKNWWKNQMEYYSSDEEW